MTVIVQRLHLVIANLYLMKIYVQLISRLVTGCNSCLRTSIFCMYKWRVAGKKLELGPIGEVVSNNVGRFRKAARLNYTELSEALKKFGRDIPPLGVRRLEEGERRVDVDDLVALSLALNVSPLALLLPTDASSLVAEGDSFPAERIWDWAFGADSLTGSDPATVIAYVLNSNPFGDWSDALGENADDFIRSLPGAAISARDVDVRPGHLTLRFSQPSQEGDDGNDQ